MKKREDAGSNTSPLLMGVGFVTLALLLFVVVLTVSFFFNVRRPEVVMVPNVLRLDLQTALLDLQKKELNARLQLRFSERADQRELVIDQQPKGGSPVPIDSKVVLTVSKGVIAERVPNYVGELLDAVRADLEQWQRGGKKKFYLERQIFIDSDQPAGMVVQQVPRAGTPASGEVGLKLWLSRGKGDLIYRSPNYLGRLSLDVAAELGQQNRPFVMTFDEQSGPQPSSVVLSQQPEVQQRVSEGTIYLFTISRPVEEDEQTFGLFSYELSTYPAPVRIKLEARFPNQLTETLFQTRHQGGLITVPYLLPLGSELILLVNDLPMEQLRVGELR